MSRRLTLTLVSVALATTAGGCDRGADRAQDLPVRSGGPVVDSMPSALKSCAPEPRPQVTVVPVPGGPVAVAVIRAYHVCLGEYAALLRLEGVAARAVTQVVIERQWWDVHGQRPPRVDRQVVTRLFERGTVRYLRLRWREGIANRGERVVRLRLRRGHYAEGAPFDAGPWPAAPPPREVARPAAGLSDKLRQIRGRVQSATEEIHRVHRRLAQHPLVRHRPGPMPAADASAAPPAAPRP